MRNVQGDGREKAERVEARRGNSGEQCGQLGVGSRDETLEGGPRARQRDKAGSRGWGLSGMIYGGGLPPEGGNTERDGSNVSTGRGAACGRGVMSRPQEPDQQPTSPPACGAEAMVPGIGRGRIQSSGAGARARAVAARELLPAGGDAEPASPMERAREVLARLKEEVVVRTRRFRRENPEMFDFVEATPTSSPQSRGSDVASDASQWSYGQRSVSEVLPLDELIQGMLKQRGSLTELLRGQLAGDLADMELLHRAVRELLKNDPERLAQTVREYLRRAERVQAVAESLSRCAMEDGGYER